MAWTSLALAEIRTRPTDTDDLMTSVTPTNYNFIQKKHGVLDKAMVLTSCVEKPFLLVLSPHWFLDHSKASYYIVAAHLKVIISIDTIIFIETAVTDIFLKLFW